MEAFAAATPGVALPVLSVVCRRRAVEELRAILAAVAIHRAVAVLLEDVHLCDPDSADLVDMLLADGPPRGVMVLATLRASAEEAAALPRVIGSFEAIQVAALPHEEAILYARRQLRAYQRDDLGLGLAPAIAAAGGKRPVLIELLARLLAPRSAAERAEIESSPPAMDRLLEVALAAMPTIDRAVLERVALDGAPIFHEVLDRALEQRACYSLDRLCEAGLIAFSEDRAAVRVTHAQVREAIVRLIPEERRASLRRALADAHRRCARGDLARAAQHCLGADAWKEAGELASEAARQAKLASAYGLAADLCELALCTDPRSRSLRLRLADVQAAAGRFEAAANNRLRVALAVRGGRRLDLAAQACEQLFLAGRRDRGLRTAAMILSELGDEILADDDHRRALLLVELAALRSRAIRRLTSRRRTRSLPSSQRLCSRNQSGWAPSPGSLASRRDPLQRLARALRGLKCREPRVVVVQGPAGAGKSALVRHFLATVRGAVPQALVLEGRCDAHEAVPYRAFDRIIDELARFLIACPEGQRAAYLADGVRDLAVIFPILTRVPGVTRDDAVDPSTPAARDRAFAELRAALQAIAGERPLILSIANLHRSDRDSLRLLAALTDPGEPLPMMVLTTLRGTTGEPPPIDLSEFHAPLEVVEVDMLSAEETVPYARERLRAVGSTDDRLARALALACRGDTRLLARLAPHVARRPPALPDNDAVLDLGELLAPILVETSPLARRLLEILTLAGGAVACGLLGQAAGVRGNARSALLELRERDLVDVDAAEDSPEDAVVVRCVSEAVAAAISAAIPAERRVAIHRALAQAHRGSIHGDEERCVDHLLHAGDTARARDHAANAALMAQSALAFDQAVRLYRLAVACDPGAAELRRRLADALAASGDYEHAAVERLRAARGASGRRRLELALRACDHFFLAGRGDRGLTVAAGVLRELALDLPAADDDAERVLARELACLRGHPLEFHPQVQAQIGGDLLLRVDAPLCIGRHLREVDPTRAAILLLRAAQAALLAGEPARVAQAFALVATVIVGRDRCLAARLLARADALATRTGDESCAGLVALARGHVRLHEADAMAALADLAHAREILCGRVALACAALRTRDHERCNADVERAIATLERLGDAPAILGEVALLRAGLAHLRGERAQAMTLLEEADRCFLAAGMSTAQSVVMLRQGDLTGGAAGQVLRARARHRLRGEGICEPDQWAASCSPSSLSGLDFVGPALAENPVQ